MGDDAAGRWDFRLPSLGADMDSGTIVDWHVDAGDRVERGDVVAVVATEKSDVDVEIWHAGTVERILVEVGEEVPVGTPVLRMSGGADAVPSDPDREPIVAPGEEAGSPAQELVAAPVPGVEPTATKPAGSATAPRPAAFRDVGARDGLMVSPFARTLADERGVDLTTVIGTGPDGAVLARDVPAGGHEPVASITRQEAPRRDSEEPPSDPTDMRAAIAERMSQANRDIPQYFLELDVEVTSLEQRLLAYNDVRPVSERILPAAAFLKATAAAIEAVPEFNGRWVRGSFEPASAVDIAMAISLRTGGLVTPTILAVDQRSLAGVMDTLRQMVKGARAGRLRSSWMRDAGITVTNLGERGADRVLGVIFPPQVGLVGFGRIVERPWVVDGAIEVRSIVTASLVADHRWTDGATGSRFLSVLSSALSTMEVP